MRTFQRPREHELLIIEMLEAVERDQDFLRFVTRFCNRPFFPQAFEEIAHKSRLATAPLVDFTRDTDTGRMCIWMTEAGIETKSSGVLT